MSTRDLHRSLMFTRAYHRRLMSTRALHRRLGFLVRQYDVLIMGLANAGKTTYLEGLKEKFIINYKAKTPIEITNTVGLSVGSFCFCGKNLNFLDLGDQEESRWDIFFPESHALIYVVDSSDRDRIRDSVEMFDKIVSNESLNGVPVLVIANKRDIPDCMNIEDVAILFCQSESRYCMVEPISALFGDRIDRGIQWLCDCIQRNYDVRPPMLEDKAYHYEGCKPS